MSVGFVILIVFIIGFIFSGILLLKQSAKKFDLSDEQLAKIKAREQEIKSKEKK